VVLWFLKLDGQTPRAASFGRKAQSAALLALHLYLPDQFSAVIPVSTVLFRLSCRSTSS